MASFTDPPLHGFADRAHRHLLEHPANLHELIQQVDPRIAPGLDMAHARLLPRDQLLPNWRRSENDLLFEIPFCSADPESATSTLVSVLVEHQSQPDPAMPLRTLLEATLHWTEQWRAWQGRQPREQPLRLSPLLAIVFHTGEGHWRCFRNIADLIVPPPEFRRYVPAWKPIFWHLKRRPPAALRHAAGAWLRVMAVVRLDQAPAAVFERTFAEVARSLEPLAEHDKMRWHDLMAFLMAWAEFRRDDPEHPHLRELAAESHQNTSLREELRTMSQTIRNSWEGRIQRAVVEGEARGEARGALRTRREDLRLLLEQRFGPLPAALAERIEASDDLNQLQASILRVPAMHSLDEFHL